LPYRPLGANTNQEENMPVVRISLIAGRSKEQKAKVAAAVTQAMVDHAGSTADHVNVVFDEQSRENWAISGKLLSEG
jgi:4-oxalocrotonate tautomerase